MFLLNKPSPEEIHTIIARDAHKELSYRDVGITRGGCRRTSLRRLHHRCELGSGGEVFERAVKALCSWCMYRTGFTEVFPPGASIEEGQNFATVVHHLGFWSVNPCRVVYRESTEGDARTEAFAIGTLPDHAERGEERFQVEWTRFDDKVFFDILAFAEPRHWLAQLGSPIVRALQHDFGVAAMRSMQSAVR